MKSKFIDTSFKYDGTQLKSLYAYLEHNLLGDSIISWQGPCDVSFQHMIDGEDLKDQSAICGNNMLHFIIEAFDQSLAAGVSLQRLMASIIKDEIQNMSSVTLVRNGDDIYWKDQKLSISIASQSIRSIMIHFAVNITNEGTPVKTCSLSDFKIEPISFSKTIMDKFKAEFETILEATYKVKSLT